MDWKEDSIWVEEANGILRETKAHTNEFKNTMKPLLHPFRFVALLFYLSLSILVSLSLSRSLRLHDHLFILPLQNPIQHLLNGRV